MEDNNNWLLKISLFLDDRVRLLIALFDVVYVEEELAVLFLK